MSSNLASSKLRRDLGITETVFMGLGSMLGTGIFVSVGLATQITGASVLIAITIAAFIAICNGLNSAQLAANHPVSGGTYEYGYRYLNPILGFTAGWVFLLAKCASAATAALGFADYVLFAIGGESQWRLPIACLAAIVLTLLTLGGLRRSNWVNTIIVGVTLLTLGVFVAWSMPLALTAFAPDPLASDLLNTAPTSLLQATALMFVAYTGYGRIATMGEEVRNPRRTIPQAMIICLSITMLIYLAVAGSGIGAVGADFFATPTESTSSPNQGAANFASVADLTQAAPLARVMHAITGRWGAQVMTIGAVTAMMGVLLNLILGVSRVVMAMGRRGDLPRVLSYLNGSHTSPTWATLLTGCAIALLTLTNHVKTTWSFSAFCILIYYGITNLAALRLSAQERLYPQWLAIAGLGACLFLAFWVDMAIWRVGLGLILVGLIWHWFRRDRVSTTGSSD